MNKHKEGSLWREIRLKYWVNIKLIEMYTLEWCVFIWLYLLINQSLCCSPPIAIKWGMTATLTHTNAITLIVTTLVFWQKLVKHFAYANESKNRIFTTYESTAKFKPVFPPLLHRLYRILRPSLQNRCFHFRLRVCVKLPFWKCDGQFPPSFS